MPEGDTIHRTAARLRPVLVDKPLVNFEAPRVVGRQPHPGEIVVAVEAVGKNLLIHFDGGLVLHTHMKMTGSWHMYRTGERWQRPRHLMRALVAVEDWMAVCFAAPVVRIYHSQSSQPSPVAHLGPDLCDADADIDLAVERIATIAEPGTTVAEVLLDQRIACGIGNVYKSETLWANRLSPFVPVEEVDGDMRRRLMLTAAKQLQQNLASNSAVRTTVPGGLAVYGRRGQPCRACSTPIKMRVHGEQRRSTYWCPACQRGAE